MIIRGKNPPLLPFCYATVIDIRLNMLGLKKTVDFLRFQYVKISIKAPVFATDIAK